MPLHSSMVLTPFQSISSILEKKCFAWVLCVQFQHSTYVLYMCRFRGLPHQVEYDFYILGSQRIPSKSTGWLWYFQICE